jgi:hypothetical protein
LRGVPLTPDQVDTLAEVYTRTGNYETAGAAIGVSGSVARRALRRRGESDRVALHVRACARGLRRGRTHLAKSADLLARVLNEETGAGVSLEPRDLAALTNAQARLTDALIALADREDRRRNALLTRAKARAEIEALRRNDNDSGDLHLIVRIEGGDPAVGAHPQAGGDLPEQ